MQRIVLTKGGMAVVDPMLADTAHMVTFPPRHSLLVRDTHNGLVANNVLAPSPPFGKIKSCFINKDEFMRSVSEINIIILTVQ